MSYTLTDIQQTVRELSFDRFPLSTIILKRKVGYTVTTNSTGLVISNNSGPQLTATWAAYPTFLTLANYLIAQGYPIAYAGYWAGNEQTTSILPMVNANMNKPVSIMMQYLYSDDTLSQYIQLYFQKVLKMEVPIGELNSEILQFNNHTVSHCCLWNAITVVNARRIVELSAQYIGEYYTDGSGLQMKGNLGYAGDSINVNIGSVFSMSQDNTAKTAYFSEGYNMVGSDNVLGDKDSFYFKLYLKLRDDIEQEYEDFNFRKETGFTSRIHLEKDLNLRTYYDSYPYTISPLSRGILP